MSAFGDLLTPCPFEFEKCTPKCSRSQMNEGFLAMLEEANRLYPLRLSSAYRSPYYERKHGRSGTSAHCLGKAVDILTPDSRTRFHVLEALYKAGFTRFGIGPRFIHVDNDVNPTRPERCIFLEV